MPRWSGLGPRGGAHSRCRSDRRRWDPPPHYWAHFPEGDSPGRRRTRWVPGRLADHSLCIPVGQHWVEHSAADDRVLGGGVGAAGRAKGAARPSRDLTWRKDRWGVQHRRGITRSLTWAPPPGGLAGGLSLGHTTNVARVRTEPGVEQTSSGRFAHRSVKAPPGRTFEGSHARIGVTPRRFSSRWAENVPGPTAGSASRPRTRR